MDEMDETALAANINVGPQTSTPITNSELKPEEDKIQGAENLNVGPQTSTPITNSALKPNVSGLDSSEEELDVDSLDDNTVEHLLPLFRQIRDEYASIDERTTAVLEKVGVTYDQLSDEAKVAVDSLVEHQKLTFGMTTAASAVTLAMKKMEKFSKDEQDTKLKEGASQLSEMLAEQTESLEKTKLHFSDVMKLAEDEELSLKEMERARKPDEAAKKKKSAEQCESRIETLQMGEVTPQAALVEMEKTRELEKEVEELKMQLKEFGELPPNIEDAQKVLRDAKQNLALLRSQLKALYKP